MALPSIQFQTIAALTGTPDLTTLTGGPSTDDSLLGFTGADYCIPVNFGFNVYKANGGQQLLQQRAGGWTSGIYSWPIVVAYSDSQQGSVGSPRNESASLLTSGEVGAKIFYQPLAGPELRRLRWYGVTDGAISVTATPSDGSHAPVVFALPSSGNASFLCTYRARTPDSTMLIEIARTTSVGGYVGPMCLYLDSPTPAPRPRGALFFSL